MTRSPGTDEALAPEDQPFFEGLESGEIRVPWCAKCEGGVWPPRVRCPRCYEEVPDAVVLSGLGTIYSFSVIHRGDGPLAGREPYVYAYITLEAGPTIPANVLGADPATIRVGAHVRLASPEERAGLPGAVFIAG